MKFFAILVFLLTGCAALEQHAIEHPETTVAQAVVVGCRGVDVYTTLKIIGQGGHELNPFLAGVVHSVPQFIVVEAALMGLMVWLEDKVTPNEAVGIAALTCLAPAHNLGQIK